jgi:hypothetical protein
MPSNTVRNLFSQWGIEFESEILSEGNTSRILREYNLSNIFGMAHDASINADWFTASGLVFTSRPPDCIDSSNFTAGSELVSGVLPFDSEELTILKRLTFMLENCGEKERSYRGSVHFHIDCTASIKLIRNFLYLAKHLEDVFYYIGGQGYPHRGTQVNEFLYCRPITKWGPTVVPSNQGDNVLVFNCNDLLEARSMNDFFNRLGGANNQSVAHMHPARYFWINFYSLQAHDTLEFRVFNKTLNPVYLLAELMLCRHFITWAAVNTFSGKTLQDLPENSIFDDRSKEDIIETFVNFCKISNFDEKLMDVLVNIISLTPEIRVPKHYVRSHVRYSCVYTENYQPTRIPSSQITSIRVDDIHARRGERDR